MTLIYPIGIPTTYASLLWKYRHTLCSVTNIQREEAEGFPTIGHVLFLTDAYRTEYYWFECLECVRRLLLASAVGMVAADSAAAPTIGLLIALAFIHVFDYYRPYKSPRNSSLGVVLAYSTALLFLGALLIKTTAENDDASDQKVFGFLCTATLFAGPVMILVFEVHRKFCGPKAATEEQLVETVERKLVAAKKEVAQKVQVREAIEKELAAARKKVGGAEEEKKRGASSGGAEEEEKYGVSSMVEPSASPDDPVRLDSSSSIIGRARQRPPRRHPRKGLENKIQTTGTIEDI